MVSGNQLSAARLQLAKNFASLFLLERLDRVLHDADVESAAQQAVRGAEHTVFRDHAKDKKIGHRVASTSNRRRRLGIRRLHIDPREERAGIWIVKDIERVLFQKNLPVGAEIARKNKIALVWNGKQAGCARLGN